jgi:hypothetical protein
MSQQVNELVNQPFLGAEAESLPFGGDGRRIERLPTKKEQRAAEKRSAGRVRFAWENIYGTP